jgi:hypothetical protein
MPPPASPSTRPGNRPPFAERIDYCDRQIVLAATGGILTMLTESGSGTLAGGAHSDAGELSEACEKERVEMARRAGVLRDRRGADGADGRSGHRVLGYDRSDGLPAGRGQSHSFYDRGIRRPAESVIQVGAP